MPPSSPWRARSRRPARDDDDLRVQPLEPASHGIMVSPRTGRGGGLGHRGRAGFTASAAAPARRAGTASVSSTNPHGWQVERPADPPGHRGRRAVQRGPAEQQRPSQRRAGHRRHYRRPVARKCPRAERGERGHDPPARERRTQGDDDREGEDAEPPASRGRSGAPAPRWLRRPPACAECAAPTARPASTPAVGRVPAAHRIAALPAGIGAPRRARSGPAPPPCASSRPSPPPVVLEGLIVRGPARDGEVRAPRATGCRASDGCRSDGRSTSASRRPPAPRARGRSSA